jgi:phage FluMu protein Com
MRVNVLKIGAKMNKLDAFNNDKIKCPKCKEYWEWTSHLNGAIRHKRLWFRTREDSFLCINCYDKWIDYIDNPNYSASLHHRNENAFNNWCKDEQS